MASLCFTLLPEALPQLHDVLICLAKFSENVTLEAEYDFVRGFFLSQLTFLSLSDRFC